MYIINLCHCSDECFMRVKLNTKNMEKEISMNKKYTQEAILLTQKFLQDYHQKNPETVFSLCAEDMTWIGAQIEQYYIGFEQFKKAILEIVEEMFCCHLIQQEFMIAQNSGNICTVIGRYTVLGDDEKHTICGQQRCVCVWEKIDGELKIKHLSTFSPLNTWKVEEGEKFVNSLSEYMKCYIHKLVRMEKAERTLVIDNGRGITQFVSLYTVMWIEAQGRNCVVYTEDEDIDAKMSIGEIREQLNDFFVQIHRGYIVNLKYVKSIKPYSLTLQDGTELSIPQKKYTEVRQRIYMSKYIY